MNPELALTVVVLLSIIAIGIEMAWLWVRCPEFGDSNNREVHHVSAHEKS